jgi:hypothetical protein
MRALALLAVLLWQAVANEPPVAQPSAMRYQRTIRLPGGHNGAGQTCAVLDAAIFSHAAVALADLRIFPVGTAAGVAHELPYAITMSEAAREETTAARVLNLGWRNGRIVFDLEMPQRAYTGVTLQLDPALHDFIATAIVFGSDAPGDKTTALGTFTLFDLVSQRLARATSIPLSESTFRYLHVELSVSAIAGAAAIRFAPSMVLGASVPPSREAQTVYSMVAETSLITTKGRETVATFELPAHVPVERVSFAIAPGFKENFSREVRVSALTVAAKNSTGTLHPADDTDADSDSNDGRAPLPEVVDGSILRVHASAAGREIRTELLGVPAILGANLQRAAKVEVTVENGDDQPLPITAVRLEMRQRKICFAAPVGLTSSGDTGTSSGTDSGLALYYGNSELDAPVYDYSRLFVASSRALAAELGPEALNTSFQAPAVEYRSFAERHPELLWIALIAAISALGMIAMQAAKGVARG